MWLTILFDSVNELRENVTREDCVLGGTLYVFILWLSVLMCGLLTLLLLFLLLMALQYAT